MKNKYRIKVKLLSISLFIIFVSQYSFGSNGIEHIILGKKENVSYDECLEVLQKGNQIYSKTLYYGDTESLDLRIIYGEYIYFFDHSIDTEDVEKPKNIDKGSILYKLLEGVDTLRKQRIEGSYIMCNGKYKLNFVDILKE